MNEGTAASEWEGAVFMPGLDVVVCTLPVGARPVCTGRLKCGVTSWTFTCIQSSCGARGAAID
jgi:hypothetical protein